MTLGAVRSEGPIWIQNRLDSVKSLSFDTIAGEEYAKWLHLWLGCVFKNEVFNLNHEEKVEAVCGALQRSWVIPHKVLSGFNTAELQVIFEHSGAVMWYGNVVDEANVKWTKEKYVHHIASYCYHVDRPPGACNHPKILHVLNGGAPTWDITVPKAQHPVLKFLQRSPLNSSRSLVSEQARAYFPLVSQVSDDISEFSDGSAEVNIFPLTLGLTNCNYQFVI